MPTASSRTTGVRDLSLRPRTKRLDAQGHGRQGRRARGLPKIVKNGTNNGFFVHSRAPLVAERGHRQAARPRRSPLVQRPAEGRDPGRQVAEGRARDRSTSRRVQGRARRQRAAGEGPDRLRLGGRRQALGRRDGRLPAGRRRQGEAGRRGPLPRGHRRRRPLRQGRRPSSTACRSRPACCPGGTACSSPRPPTSSTPRTATATARPTTARSSSPGFTEGNQQHRVNGFELGLDGWIYGANGDSGGTVRSLKTGKTVNIQGRDFRFRPDTGEFETESGQTQFGRHRDDWGDWFGNNNPTWGWHFVLAESDLKRNPHFAPPDPRQTLEPDTQALPRQPHLARFNDPEAANHVTSANSPTPYRDDLFGPHFAHQPVRQRAGPQPRPPDGARARRPDLRGRARRARRPRVPGLQRQLVPADAAQDRPRRRPLDRRHVPRGDRAPRVDPGRLAEEARPPRRQRPRAGSTASSPSTRRPGRSPGSTGSTPPAWSPPSTAPAAGSATRPSGCSCTRTTRPRSSRSATRPAPTRRPQTRVQASGRSPLLNGLDEATAHDGPGGHASRRSAATRSEGEPRACSPAHRSWPRPCSAWPTTPTRGSDSSSPWLGNWNDPRAGQRPGEDLPGATRATAGSARPCSARRPARGDAPDRSSSSGGGEPPRGGRRAARRAGRARCRTERRSIRSSGDRHAGGAGGPFAPGNSRRCGACSTPPAGRSTRSSSAREPGAAQARRRRPRARPATTPAARPTGSRRSALLGLLGGGPSPRTATCSSAAHAARADRPSSRPRSPRWRARPIRSSPTCSCAAGRPTRRRLTGRDPRLAA